MKILFAVSEAFPFAKSGGLADVAYSLPKALRNLGVDIRVIMPKYSDIHPDFTTKMKHICHFTVPVGWRNQYCGIEYLNLDGVPFYFVDNEYYFKRPGYYGYYDDGERFSFFSRAVCEAVYHLDFDVDIIHVNDWHTSVIPVLLKAHYGHSDKHNKIKTILTIHNLKYQGIFPKEVMYDLLSLPDEYFSEDKLKFYDAISFLKGGIIYSDKVVTVSRTYANEVRTLSYGEGLHGLLSGIGEKLIGIINGIDYEVYNPATDKLIFVNYDSNTFENRKKENKFRLQQMLNLPVSDEIVLIGMVSRLTKEKGIELIERIINKLLTLPVQLVILGAGDYHYEQMLKQYAGAFPSKVSANICYSEELARKIYAGSDMYLMPSLTEPCGISQLIAMRYGSVPIVRETGGLKDTVKPYNQFTGEGWGFSFANYDPAELFATIKYALSIYNDKNQWRNIVHQAMTQDNSWNASAYEYQKVYESLLNS
ncbi:starch synthase [Caldicellulosiruptor bescii]|uniref:Glycogen synthase n=2 Tax=Caldicellulosiruptor bescii TaxID=31899 RepID=GLGA_CALBD|nr:glycogen synthase GlgA [Caldicellulosiruptor bescii]B9MPC0.1 RecName: Full=Glycogen synthase; AltName: Full=Starch [bacterial glycogen] synthase [Caldicellulosiruptor bescii DSM 6725]ACM59681.1 glycogen/starch synthase, ADP-glucose type [Caldicellulosiruptor bescii DSM 6725]PBC89706.1 starch synthase [Caldicellulosiruptor bescii]PBC90029.1 starch synthase [Caldicellulosiruptor bescii]PBD04540.1 starch synthase [Caldicellulosiruptor bescii]PBD05826.1 starch synthase [Caldicellulosiruptor be